PCHEWLCAARTRHWYPTDTWLAARSIAEIRDAQLDVQLGWVEIDVRHARHAQCVEQIAPAAGQTPVLLDAEQHMGGPAAIGDEHRPLQRRTLGTADVLIEFAARECRRGHRETSLPGNVVTLLRPLDTSNPADVGRHSSTRRNDGPEPVQPPGIEVRHRSVSLANLRPAHHAGGPLRRHDAMIFRWFESLIDAFKEPVDGMPPQSTWRFYAFYLRQVWPVFLAAMLVGFIVAIIEVALFGFIGRIVDMAKGLPAADFFQVHGWELLGMALVALVARPLFNGLHDLLVNQSIVPNLTNRIRWQNHRYVMRQSLGFFQNDYAGRIANRIMQTGASLRSSAVQIVDAIWYVVIYTGSAIALFARADVWLALPLFAWVFLYVGLLWFFVPRLKQRSWQASAARSKLM